MPTPIPYVRAIDIEYGRADQVSPLVVVCQSTFDEKYSLRGLTGEKSTGIVRTTR